MPRLTENYLNLTVLRAHYTHSNRAHHDDLGNLALALLHRPTATPDGCPFIRRLLLLSEIQDRNRNPGTDQFSRVSCDHNRAADH